MTITGENVLFIGAILLFFSVLVSKTNFKLGMPVLVAFLFVGMLFGVDGIGIQFDNFKDAQFIGMIAMCIILFSGGMDTKFKAIKPILAPGILLATLGVLFTTLFTGLFTFKVSELLIPQYGVTLGIAVLLAATMSSTDSASVFNVLRSARMNLKPGLQPLLELESGSNDPMAFMLTTIIINTLNKEGIDSDNIFVKGVGYLTVINIIGVIQFGVGGGLGFLCGKLCAWIMNKIKLHNQSLYSILILSFVFFTYSIADMFGGNGYLAVYIAGIVLGNSRLPEKKSVTSFLDGLVWLVQIMMFLILGLLVNPHEMLGIAVPSIIIGVFVMLVGRPLSVIICLLPFHKKIDWRSMLFTSWVGLRGAAPILFATYPVVAGIEGSKEIFNIVFFITLISLIFQGSSIPLAARLLKVGTRNEEKPKETFGIEIPEETNTQCEHSIVENETLLKDYGLPENTLVMMVRRGDKYIIPKGNLHLHKGDELLLISEKESNK